MTGQSVNIPGALGFAVLGMSIVFLMLTALMLIIKIMSRGSAPASRAVTAGGVALPDLQAKKLEPAPVQTLIKTGPEAPGSAGELDLHSVEPRTAAMLMAIVADEMGAPINELRFISIREIK